MAIQPTGAETPPPPPPVTPPVESVPPAVRPANNNGCRCLTLAALGCLLLPLLVLGGLLVTGITSIGALTTGVNSAVEGLGQVLAGPPPQAQIASSQTIVQGIQPLGQLVSISAQLAKADVQVGVRQGALNACGFSANHVSQGTVEGGIDLTRIGEDDIQYDEDSNTYTILLPPSELTSCRVNYIRQYDRSSTACAVDWDQARLLANYVSLIEFRDDAVEGGLLERAEQQARLVLGNFVAAITNANVRIEFREAETPVIPPSCQPAPPQGWVQQPDGSWERP